MKPVQPHLTQKSIPCFAAVSGSEGQTTDRAEVRVVLSHRDDHDRLEVLVCHDWSGASVVMDGTLNRAQAKCLLTALQAALLADLVRPS